MADLDRTLFDAAPDAQVAVDKSGIIRLANPRVTALFGWDVDEIEGQPVEALIPPRYRRVHRDKHRPGFMQEPVAKPMGLGRVLDGLRQDGTEFPIEIALNATAGGELAIATVRDVAAWRRPVEALNLKPLMLLLIVNAILNAITLAAVYLRH